MAEKEDEGYDKKEKEERVFIDGREGREDAFMTTNKQKRVDIYLEVSSH